MNMKQVGMAVCLAVAGVSGAYAQDRMTAQACELSWAAWSALADLETPETQAAVTDDGWCALTAAQVQVEQGVSLGIETLRWRGTDMARIAEGLPPRGLEFAAKGVFVQPQTGDPLFDYLLGLQDRSEHGMEFGALIRWDGLQKALMVDEAYFAFDATNRVTLEARIEGVDLTDAGTIAASLGQAGLRSGEVDATFDGWFERELALPLGMMLLTGENADPATEVDQLKRQAIDVVNGFSEDFMAERSREALAEFLTSLPQPRGVATLQVTADPVVGLARLAMAPAGGDPAQMFETLSDGVTATVIWTPQVAQ